MLDLCSCWSWAHRQLTSEPKIKRSSSIPISVRKAATDVTVKRLAVEKHMAHMQHHKSFVQSQQNWKRSGFFDPVLYILGSKECFSVEKYKESIGKPYNRVNLYLCRKRDYEGNNTFGFRVLLLSIGLLLPCRAGLYKDYKQSWLVANQLPWERYSMCLATFRALKDSALSQASLNLISVCLLFFFSGSISWR